VVWLPGIKPLPPKRYRGTGRPPVMPRRTARQQPTSVKALLRQSPDSAFQAISWRKGTNETLSSHFATVRVHHHRLCRRGDARQLLEQPRHIVRDLALPTNCPAR